MAQLREALLVHSSVVEIETERLRLRAWQPEDFEDFARISADREVMRYIGNGQPATRSRSVAPQRLHPAGERTLGLE